MINIKRSKCQIYMTEQINKTNIANRFLLDEQFTFLIVKKFNHSSPTSNSPLIESIVKIKKKNIFVMDKDNRRCRELSLHFISLFCFLRGPMMDIPSSC